MIKWRGKALPRSQLPGSKQAGGHDLGNLDPKAQQLVKSPELHGASRMELGGSTQKPVASIDNRQAAMTWDI